MAMDIGVILDLAQTLIIIGMGYFIYLLTNSAIEQEEMMDVIVEKHNDLVEGVSEVFKQIISVSDGANHPDYKEPTDDD